MNYKGLIFDMDGTLTVPAIDFISVRRELGIIEGDLVPIIEAWPEARRNWAWRLIEQYEDDVRSKTKLQPGVHAALVKFRQADIKLGILTRNSQLGVDALLNILDIEFDAILTREHTHIKPAPEPVWEIVKDWGIASAEVMVIGDYIHDIECGRAAGAKSCFFANPGMTSYADLADFTVSTFAELEALVFS
ncbi:MAG: HAD family hydrolase [Victivallaceae bacterium]|nr:HAD family hydrolase [Victivallaceae bacterium]